MRRVPRTDRDEIRNLLWRALPPRDSDRSLDLAILSSIRPFHCFFFVIPRWVLRLRCNAVRTLSIHYYVCSRISHRRVQVSSEIQESYSIRPPMDTEETIPFGYRGTWRKYARRPRRKSVSLGDLENASRRVSHMTVVVLRRSLSSELGASVSPFASLLHDALSLLRGCDGFAIDLIFGSQKSMHTAVPSGAQNKGLVSPC